MLQSPNNHTLKKHIKYKLTIRIKPYKQNKNVRIMITFLFRYLQNVLPHLEQALKSLFIPLSAQALSFILFSPFEARFFVTALSSFDFLSALRFLSFSMTLFSPIRLIKTKYLTFSHSSDIIQILHIMIFFGYINQIFLT